jgi:hypothetical protein
MTSKVMQLVNPETGLMRCRVCAAVHFGPIRPGSGGRFHRGAWQCQHGCRLLEARPPDSVVFKL